MRTAIVWFRRDLRVHDHPALSTAVREYERVVPVFVFDPALLHGRFASAARTDFMLGCLRALDEQLGIRGSGLVTREGAPGQELVELARETGAEAVLHSGEVSPHARRRDAAAAAILQANGVSLRSCPGTYVTDVAAPRTRDGRPYSVFTPFHRAWRQLARREVLPAPRQLPALPSRLRRGRIPARIEVVGPSVPQPVLAPGEPAARTVAWAWLRESLGRYGERHDIPAAAGTSQLSPYLRWGCLSALELEQRARSEAGPAAEPWTRQLCWREFYAHVLHHWPDNARLEFQTRLRGLEWEDDSDRLHAWQEGQTGYPLVDAGMRELACTGWMHNRVRLVVGSFLTKDLHLDWRDGEQWFERLLLDGEPAQNNGNWQWIASVGTDPAPVFRRLYNPTLQARRVDPDGEYIRRWVPELRELSGDAVFEPWGLDEHEQRLAGCVLGRDYPHPIVDHALERRRALERYGALARG